MSNLAQSQLDYLSKASGMLSDIAIVLDDPNFRVSLERNRLIDAIHEVQRLIGKATD